MRLQPLLHSVARGDPDAVRACIERYGPLVWSIARRFGADAADAEDAAQEAFIELWKKAERYDPARSSEPSFVAMIVRRRLIDRARMRAVRAKSEVAIDDAELATPIVDSPDAVEIADEARHAARALSELRPEERRVLELSIFHGLSHDEIARAVRMPLGTVKTHVRKGLQRVREALGVEPRAPATKEARA